MKRTTLILDEGTIIELKRIAAARGQTLSALVDEFLADGILRWRAAERLVRALPVFSMGAPRVDIGNRGELCEAMERK